MRFFSKRGFMHVYKITNKINGKFYVGITKEQDLRAYWWKQKAPIFRLSEQKPYLYRAVRKHGWDNFVIEALVSNVETREQLYALEIEWIAKLNAQNPSVGYNLCPGGIAPGGKLRDLTGQRFGLLEVLRFHSFEKSPSGRTITRWEVKCDCGTDERVVRSECLVRGKTRSCGCIRRARAGGFVLSSGRGRVMPNGMIVPLAKPVKR
jgi:hypothetical protein